MFEGQTSRSITVSASEDETVGSFDRVGWGPREMHVGQPVLLAAGHGFGLFGGRLLPAILQLGNALGVLRLSRCLGVFWVLAGKPG